MKLSIFPYTHPRHVVVIGAGIAGLAASLELAHLGYRVTVFETAPSAGGKLRCRSTAAGPVDIGPTVLTLLSVFHDLFESIGENLEEHITPIRQKLLARHFWRDGTMLDIFDDYDESCSAVERAFGLKGRKEFSRYYSDTRDLFRGFDRPMMRAQSPSVWSMVKTVAMNPTLALKMHPRRSLEELLERRFSDPRLAQLFGRYATYIGGSPNHAPALLSLIWQAEAQGVWALKGGMMSLATALERLAKSRGVDFQYNSTVDEIEVVDGVARGVILENGDYVRADCVVFNGDPRALSMGFLGPDAQAATADLSDEPRALSAYVWGFSAQYTGPKLAHNTVFFADIINSEFRDIDRGYMPTDPNIYICAQDRGMNTPYPNEERFEIIVNAAPIHEGSAPPDPVKEFEQCQARVFNRLEKFGVQFQTQITSEHLTSPWQFHQRFPASAGSLYGQSPNGLTAALKRPTARTQIPNLYLLGGGAHPGAGLPMATLSARHAVAAISADQISQ